MGGAIKTPFGRDCTYNIYRGGWLLHNNFIRTSPAFPGFVIGPSSLAWICGSLADSLPRWTKSKTWVFAKPKKKKKKKLQSRNFVMGSKSLVFAVNRNRWLIDHSQKYKDSDVEVVRKDGIILLREMAAEVKNFMDFKMNAVMVSSRHYMWLCCCKCTFLPPSLSPLSVSTRNCKQQFNFCCTECFYALLYTK